MEHVENKTRHCPFCGKEINYRYVTEDGTDWEGHHRGSYKSWTDGKECSCEKMPFKRMCLNCKYNHVNSCTCEKVIEELKKSITNQSPFVVSTISTEIKDETKRCSHWELGKIIETYFK